MRQLPELDSPDDLVLPGGKASEQWKMSELSLDLGFVNLALHSLAEINVLSVKIVEAGTSATLEYPASSGSKD